MQMPLEITFTSTRASNAVKALVAQEAAKLDRVCDHIGSCRVAIEKQPRPQRSGNPYRVRIEIHVPPRHTLVAVREPTDSGMHDPLPVVIKGAFHSMRGQLRKLVEKRQGHVKVHAEVGTMVRSEESEGEAGPQASAVRVVDEPVVRRTDDAQAPPPLGWESGEGGEHTEDGEDDR
ncbi:MAG TPA: HPF/RaiA family ribosome-associated protein [Pseudomonadales bacterium]